METVWMWSTLWVGLVLSSIVQELVVNYSPVHTLYINQLNLYEQCHVNSFYVNNRDVCDDHKVSPFFVQLAIQVAKQVKWCGVDRCETIQTLEGMCISVFTGIVVILTKRVAGVCM